MIFHISKRHIINLMTTNESINYSHKFLPQKKTHRIDELSIIG